MIPLILAAAAAIATGFPLCRDVPKGFELACWDDDGGFRTAPQRGNILPPGADTSSITPIRILPMPPHCDPGWSLVTIADQPWCARELRAPKGE